MTRARAIFLRQAIVAWLVILPLLCGENAAFPQSANATDPDVADAVEELGSASYQQRQAAYRTLVANGDAAIDAIENAPDLGDLEFATWCVDVLVKIASDKDKLPRVIAALDRLASNPANAAANLAKHHAADLKMSDEDCAVAALTAAGVRIYRSPDGNVFSVSITDDRQIVWLKHFKQLHSVTASGFDVTDTGIVTLAELPQLSNLNIRQSSVTDMGLAKLQNAAGLKSIRISADEFTSRGLRTLRGIATLERLALSSAPSIDELEALIEVGQIDSLYLSEFSVTQQGVDYLNQLSHLKRVSFSIEAIGDAQLRCIGQLTCT